MKRRFWAMAKKETIQVVRDSRTLGIAILLPLVMLLLYGYAIRLDVRDIPTAFVDESQSVQSRLIAEKLAAARLFRLIPVKSPQEATCLLDGGKVRLAVVVERDFARHVLRGETAHLETLVDGTDANTATIAIGYLSEVLARLVPGAQPRLDYRPRVLYNPSLKSTDFIVPGLIAVLLMVLGVLLTALSLVREKEHGNIEQLIVSPLRRQELILGKIFPYVVIAFFDTTLVTVVGHFWFGVPLVGSLVLLALFSFLFLLAALGAGIFLSTIAQTQTVAAMAAWLASVLPSFLLSGFVFPIASMPQWLQPLTYLIPARYFLVVARGIFLKGVGLDILWPQGLMLLAFAAVMIGAAIVRFRKRLA